MNLQLKKGSAAVPAAPVGVSPSGTNRCTESVFGEDAEIPPTLDMLKQGAFVALILD